MCRAGRDLSEIRGQPSHSSRGAFLNGAESLAATFASRCFQTLDPNCFPTILFLVRNQSQGVDVYQAMR